MTKLAKALQSAAGNAGAAGAYIEDVFSTYLFQGTSSGTPSTITNGVDLSNEGGLVWMKNRSSSEIHFLYDTARGNTVYLSTNTTSANSSYTGITFNSDGFTQDMGFSTSVNVASWTFRKAPKFFDVVTYTGDGTNYRDIAHSLGSTPGCVIVKQTSASGNNWRIWHRSLTSGYMLAFTTAAEYTDQDYITGATDTTFQVGTRGGAPVNASGQSYVAYIFAHDAGGFGDAGDQSVISCGSFTTDSGGAASLVNLGWEPQFVILKDSASGGDWFVLDTMRGMPVGSSDQLLRANLSNAEVAVGDFVQPAANGFTASSLTGPTTYIYIAIRRGPMKTPTDGTSVFTPVTRTGTGTINQKITSGFVADTVWATSRAGTTRKGYFDRLRGALLFLDSSETDGEISAAGSLTGFDNNTGVIVGNESGGWEVINGSGTDYVNWMFGRAPGFFDVVCYTGTGSATTVAHNLGVAPELMIVKQRSGANYWPVYSAAIGNDYILSLNTTGAKDGPGAPQWNNTAPTASVFSLGASSGANASGGTYVAYLFASCPGVSKVGSYTGTGTTLQVNCGFSAGARFVLIKRTDSTGGWYVWDSARGIVSGNDPYLLLNSATAEVTSTDYVDAYSAGFEISSTAPAAINASGGSFIFLAIA